MRLSTSHNQASQGATSFGADIEFEDVNLAHCVHAIHACAQEEFCWAMMTQNHWSEI